MAQKSIIGGMLIPRGFVMQDPYKILVVDDEKEICELFTEILSLEGYEVKSARSGSEAKLILKTYSPDLISIDYMLPDTVGGQLAIEIGDICPYLFISGVDPEVLDKVEFCGKLLSKPINAERLLLAAEKAINDYRYKTGAVSGF